MRFILSPVGSAGDVHPYVGLGLELRKRGHEVVFLINEYFESLMSEHGFDHIQFGTAQEFLESTNDPAIWHPRKALPHIFQNFIERYAPLHVDCVREAHTPGSVVLTSCLGVGALLTRETDQFKVLTVHLQPSVLWSNHDVPRLPGMFGPDWMRRWQYWLAETLIIPVIAGRVVNRIRAKYNLPPIRHPFRWWHSPDGVLLLFPEWYAAQQSDWPLTLQSDFPLWDQGADQSLSDEVSRFLEAGSPPIAFTPGSANRFGADFFREAVEACRQIDARCVLLSKFEDQFPTGLPDTALARSYIPLRQLLPHCSALVHHGGIGTMAQAFAAGVPQLVMALAHDQFDNGHRVQKLGAGLWTTPKRFRSRTVARQLSQLTSDPIRSRAAAIADRCDGLGLSRAVDVLERHLAVSPSPANSG